MNIEYESNSEVYASNIETQKTINGEETAGRQFIFNVDGPACGNQGFSERLETFGWVGNRSLVFEKPIPKKCWPYLSPQTNGVS